VLRGDRPDLDMCRAVREGGQAGLEGARERRDDDEVDTLARKEGRELGHLPLPEFRQRRVVELGCAPKSP